jgi:hypothetical protein
MSGRNTIIYCSPVDATKEIVRNQLIERDSDKIVFIQIVTCFFCCGRHQFFMETLKTCVIVPTLVVIFLSFLIRNRE